jgi:hypothetical protein
MERPDMTEPRQIKQLLRVKKWRAEFDKMRKEQK